MSTTMYETEAEAREAAPKLQRAYRRPIGKPVRDALGAYRQHLETKGNKASSIRTTLFRIGDVLIDPDEITGELTPAIMAKAWERYTTTPGRLSRRLPSVATRANVLNEMRTFCRWLLGQGWVKVELFAGVTVVGRRNRGKAQLDRIEDCRKFLATAIELGTSGDAGAIAAASALVLGLRASEISNTKVRDLDDGGSIWIIADAKTRAGDRRMSVPAVLRPLLLGLAKERAADARLFEGADRFWVRHAVRRICRVAGVPVISAHGLRGSHASLAVGAGISGFAVAASLGHESFAVTERHYATPNSVSGARVDRVLAALN